jgi:hypothetical protein
MELFLKLFGILLGVLARTLVPYLRKLKQGKVKEAGFGWNSLVSEGPKSRGKVKKLGR